MSEKIGEWSEISFRKRPLKEEASGLLVKILSIKEALCAVILSGRVINGKHCCLQYI